MRALVILAFGVFLASACASLSTADKAQIAADSVALGVCQALAHDCKTDGRSPAECWGVYDDCVSAHGLKDGGR